MQEEWTRWRWLLSEQQTSGQSIAEFCRERVLPVWQFYEWRKRLRAKGLFRKFTQLVTERG